MSMCLTNNKRKVIITISRQRVITVTFFFMYVLYMSGDLGLDYHIIIQIKILLIIIQDFILFFILRLKPSNSREKRDWMFWTNWGNNYVWNNTVFLMRSNHVLQHNNCVFITTCWEVVCSVFRVLFVLFDHILKNEPGAFRIYVVIIMILKGWHMEDKI